MKCAGTPDRFRSNRARGFSLIEVIASLAIMGIALAGLLRLHLSSVMAADKAESLIQATLLAEAKLNEVLGSPHVLSQPLSGLEQCGSAQYQWNTTVSEERPSDWPIRSPLQRVEVQVAWGQGRGRQQIELSTYITPSQAK